MTTTDFTREALKRLNRVPPERYESVLSELDRIADRPRGTPLRDLRHFAGAISEQTAEEMLRVIEEECEHIDYDSWGLPPGHQHGDQPASQ